MVRVKSCYSKSPKKGTRAREVMLMMLRPEGATHPEIQALYNNKWPGSCQRVIEALRNDNGWDIRSFPLPLSDPRQELFKAPRRRHPVVMRIVGKYKWDGTYRSLLDPKRLTNSE